MKEQNKEQYKRISAAETERRYEMHDRIKFDSVAGIQDIWILRLWTL